MKKIILCAFFLISFLFACSEKSETALDLVNKAEKLIQSDPNKAMENLNKAIELQPNEAKAYNIRGIVQGQRGKYQQAIEDYNKTIRLQPEYADAYNNRGVVYIGLRKYQLAVDDYNQAINLRPDYTEAYNNRGFAYLKQGKKDLGCRDLQKSCELGNCNLLESAKSKGYCPL